MGTYNRFTGDPAVKITPNGARMKFIGGQPIMDQGLENAVQISLFTKKGWWGNFLLTENEKIGVTDFNTIRVIVDIKTINDYRDDAALALKWMTETGLASKIDVVVTNPYSDQIWTKITITPPGQDAMELLFIKNGLNWILQAQNPAHERMRDVI